MTEAKFKISANDRTKAAFRSVNRRLGKMTNKIGRAKTAMLGLVGAGGLGLLVKQSLNAADNIAKMADAVGLSTKTYQELAVASGLAGIEQSQLNSNLTAWVKRVGEARAGIGPLVSFLRQYDETLLSAIQNTSNQEQAFNLMADAIQSAETKTDQAALANAAFSRAGVTMVNMMRDGSAGLQEMRDKAEELGLVLNESVIREAEEANDQLQLMGRVITTNVTRAVVNLSPRITELGKEFAAFAPKILTFIETLTGTTSIGTLTQEINNLGEARDRLLENLANVQGDNQSFIERLIGPDEEQLQEKLARIEQKILSAQIQIEERLGQQNMEAIGRNEAREAERAQLAMAAKEDALDKEFEMLSKNTDREIKEFNRAAKAKAASEKWVSERITSMQFNVAQNAVTLLRSVSGENKTAAYAVIGLQQGLAIAQTVMNTQVAAMRALAELGPIAGSAAAAKIKMLGAISVGLIGATGLVQASQVGSGGASLGSAANPAYTTPALPTPSGSQFTSNTPANSGGITTISLVGNSNSIFTGEQLDNLFEQMQDAIERGDKVLFSRNSRQALELL